MRIFFFLLVHCAFLNLPGQQINDLNLTSHSFYLPSEKIIYYKLGNKTIPLVITQYGKKQTPVCINLHDNEYTSVQAARLVLEHSGGLLIRLENKRQRLIRFRLRNKDYSFDPNGIFSRPGIEKTLKENGPVSVQAIEEVEKFAQRLLQLIPEDFNCIIALHNNNENGYSVNSYLPGGDKAADAKLVSKNETALADDLFFTTDSVIYRKMAAKGYNTVLQNNQMAKDDGSLSVYSGVRNIRYVNVETLHGKTALYKEMLESLFNEMTLIKYELP